VTEIEEQVTARQWSRIEWATLGAGVLGLALAALGGVFEPAQPFQSYLAPYLFWHGIALGSVAIILLHNLTGGNWGIALRPALDAAARTLPLLTLLFLPIAFGLHQVYPWARSETGQLHGLLEQPKAQYLNVPFFLARAAGYFAVWCATAYFVTRRSRNSSNPHAPREKSGIELNTPIAPSVTGTVERDRPGLRRSSGIGIAFYGLTATFAAIDWVMSLEPDWYSTIIGMLAVGGQTLSSLAFTVTAITVLPDLLPAKSETVAPRDPPLHARLDERLFAGAGILNDLGSLLLAFVMIWAYLAFSQFLIIWSGNLPEEISWYLNRTSGGWQWIALALAVFYFVVPFLALLSRDIKSNPRRLAAVAAGIVCTSYVAQFWTVAPAFHPRNLHVHWLDLAALIGLSGLWCWTFLRQWRIRQ
jgi:hypothetical protein